MLVVARRKGQSIVLKQEGKQDIRIHFVNYDRGIIRMGIDAPKDVIILRQEVKDNRHEERQSR
jgi:carbon storage regulator CsrA